MKIYILVSLLVCTITATPADEAVYFTDQNLKKAVENKLGLSNPTPTDMLTLTELQVDGIVSFTGLEHAKNLTSLQVNNHYQKTLDIDILSSLTNLQTLALRYCKIKDFSFLSSLEKLETLDLHFNEISGDIWALSSLTNLSTLSLSNNQIEDISALSSLTNLRTLGLHHNQIRDISPLASLVNLKELYLSANRISDISTLSALVKLETLDLSWNYKLSDISPLSSLTDLTYLGLIYNQVKDVSALSSLTKLTSLNLSVNQIQDISALSSLKKLTTLSIRYNPVSDISVLSSLPNLNNTDIRNTTWYFHQFLYILFGALAAVLVAGFAIHFLWKKIRTDKPRLSPWIKISFACCVAAPVLCWLCLDFLGYIFSKPTLYWLNRNLVFSLCILIGPTIIALAAGIFSGIVATKKTSKSSHPEPGKKLAVTALIIMSLLTILCSARILLFIAISLYRNLYYGSF